MKGKIILFMVFFCSIMVFSGCSPPRQPDDETSDQDKVKYMLAKIVYDEESVTDLVDPYQYSIEELLEKYFEKDLDIAIAIGRVRDIYGIHLDVPDNCSRSEFVTAFLKLKGKPAPAEDQTSNNPTQKEELERFKRADRQSRPLPDTNQDVVKSTQKLVRDLEARL